MSPDPLRGMDELQQPITFLDTLQRLQALLGMRVKVEFNDYGSFFGGACEGELERVETLPPDNRSIRVLVAGGGFFADPAQVKTFLTGEPDMAPTWLEFQRPGGPTITVERVAE